MNNELNELKPCPFCGGKAEEDTHIGGVICENYCTNPNTFDGGGGVWTADWNTRPIEDALNARIAKLEAENNELTERVSMLDVTGVFQKLGEMRTIELVADLKAERDEAKAMVERLIEAIELGNGVVLMHEPEISSVQKWYAKMATVIAEWREREK